MAVALEKFLGTSGSPVVATERSALGPAPFWARLCRVASWLQVHHEPSAQDAHPRTRLRGTRSHGQLTWWGRISGRQLEPLVETLRALATGELDFETPATPAVLASLEQVLSITVVVSPSCPYCPRVAASLLRMSVGSPRVNVTVVNVDTPFVSKTVRSVPSVLLGDKLVATGSVGEFALLEKLVEGSR